MNGRVSAKMAGQKPILIMELVGPAGAGKTTLSRTLSHRNTRIQIGSEIELRKPKYIPFFLSNFIALLPILLRRFRHGRWFTWDEIKALVYLKGWSGVLLREAANDDATVLLDHGPVFKLATLYEFGPQNLKANGFETWWNTMFSHWASTLDIIVWLDAPDAILERRINSRNQRHSVKGKTEVEVERFLARYRSSYQQVLAKLQSYGGPRLLQFDTSRTSIDQVAEEILSAIRAASQ
jgi:shikimate kinase